MEVVAPTLVLVLRKEPIDVSARAPRMGPRLAMLAALTGLAPWAQSADSAEARRQQVPHLKFMDTLRDCSMP